MKNIIAVLLAMLALSFTTTTNAHNDQTQIVASVTVSGVGRSALSWATGLPKTTLMEGVGSRKVTWSLADAPAGATARVQLCAYESSARVRVAESLFRTSYTNTWCQDIVIGSSLANGAFNWSPEVPVDRTADYYKIRVIFDLKDGTTVTKKSHAFRIRENKIRRISLTSPASVTLPQGGGFVPLTWTSMGIPANALVEIRLSSLINPAEHFVLTECSNTGGQLLEIPDYLPPYQYTLAVTFTDYLGNDVSSSSVIPFTVTEAVPEQ